MLQKVILLHQSNSPYETNAAVDGYLIIMQPMEFCSEMPWGCKVTREEIGCSL
jgi:hypothetical protein